MEKTEIRGLTFEDFKKLAKEKVRKDNYLTKVESWEDKILHYEFHENSDGSYYSAIIYFIEGLRKTDYCIKRYSYSYCTQIFYEDGYEIIDRTTLKKITLLEKLVSKNNEPYLFTVLEKFQEGAVKLENYK